jgi:Protein of unknown function (DUF4233)
VKVTVMRGTLSAILVFEAIIVGLAIPVAIGVSNAPRGLAIWGGLAIVVACIASAALLRSPVGVILGSLVQLAAFASGFVVSIMLALGAIFGILWFAALIFDRKIAARQAAAS